ncbi:MAG: hypothetical protein WCZ70_09395, partial [Sulfurimonadaceae bacterium]
MGKIIITNDGDVIEESKRDFSKPCFLDRHKGGAMKNAKTLSFLHFLLFVLPLSAQEAQLLSPQKRELLLQEQNRYESENEKLRNNWIAPLNLGASWG